MSTVIAFLVLLAAMANMPPRVAGWCWWNCGGNKCKPNCVSNFDNCYDAQLTKSCNSKQAFYRVQSYHKNCKEDRVWKWSCRNVVSSGSLSCSWTGYVNNWDQPLFFRCGANKIINGVQSYHDNGREDRRWRFKCCRANKHYTRNCKLSNYVNSWDGDMDFRASSNYAIVGAYSYHDNGKEDRRWKFETCEYYYCPNYPNCGSKLCEHYSYGSSCRCYSGYKLQSNGRSCKDIDECSSNNGGCSQICRNTPGSYSCSCYPGYYRLSWWWLSKNCYDRNECSSNNGGCQHSCRNTAGSYYCTCNAGFTLASNHRSCIDINECYYSNGGCQHRCVNTYGDYRCECNKGYKLNPDGKSCSPSCWNPCQKCASCSTPNKCTCVPGWTGPTCCSDINECASNKGGCQQNCHNTHGSYYCSCNQGYQISTNDRTCNDINECAIGTHGCEHKCSNTYGSYKCYCNKGYVLASNGKSCVDANECKINNGGCGIHGCINTPGSYQCQCKDGYQLSSNGLKCLDINECAQDVCEHDCYNTPGSYRCDCDTGYQLDGDHCSDINECLSNNGGCEDICVNEVGSYHCDCNDGFSLDSNGLTCSDHNECKDNNPCEQNCKNVQGTFTCSCNEGFKLRNDGRTCEDIDECSDSSSGCNQLCSNTVGSYYCSCYSSGFELIAGHTCVDINECSTNNGGCSHGCKNEEGGFTCTCPSGYALQDGSDYTCEDINECDTYNGGCDQTCVNDVGSYHCECDTGYTLDSDNLDCIDIDECSLSLHACSQTCKNIVGSYECLCDKGYTLSTEDGQTCIDIEECAEGEAECDQTCVNNIGSYECLCDTGYVLDGDKHTCNDVNECVTNNGGCADNCTNTVGSYVCYCGEGYKLAADKHACEDIDECANDEDNQCTQICNNTIGSFQCDCEIGYWLHSNGFQCDDINECDYSNGGCNHECFNTDGSYYCECRPGFEFAENSTHYCQDIAECDLGLCDHNCTEYPGSYACTCVDGYQLGNDNHSCDDIHECFQNISGCEQICHNLNGTFFCDCYSGYVLKGVTYCEDINECDTENGGCETICENFDGRYQCKCDPGYTLGDDDHSCPDINECLDNNGGCNQTCINEDGSYHCDCNPGFTIHANERDCLDIDECSILYNNECDHNCHNTYGSYECSCNDGYTLSTDNKRTCNDIDECADNSLNKCDQLCTNTNGSYYCSCSAGYMLSNDSYTCNDINECGTNNGGCEMNCSNTIGSYECSCYDGFALTEDGHSCQDINECYLNIHLCEDICINTHGSYNCSCSEGYQLNSDGHLCDDINECDVNNGGCEQLCFNDIGSYHCDCNIGYQLSNDSHSCNDVPECQTDNGNCDHRCVETVGSYYCLCNLGFYLDSSDNHTCEDINECLIPTDNNCDHQCINTYGSYECKCEDGYRLLSDQHTCEDINECDIDNGNCAHNCKNKLGTYECSCNEGYTLDSDSHSCIAQECLTKYTHPQNGSMTCNSGGQVTDTSCMFSCDPGYEIVGSSITHCLPDNTWSHSRPSCTLSHCKEYAPPKNTFVVGMNDCPTIFGSECEVGCIHGYRQNGGNDIQQCLWNDTRDLVEFSQSETIVCERISHCESNPCLHNGLCIDSDEGYTCDCTNTGYKGLTCEIGVIEMSDTPVLIVNRPSYLLKLTARPDNSLTVTLMYDTTAITSSIKQIHFDIDVTSSLFQLTGTKPGVYTLSFEVSGLAKDSFEVPDPIVILVTNDLTMNITANTVIQTSAHQSPGCCNYSIPYTDIHSSCSVGSGQSTVSFISSCQWENQSSLLTNGGVVFVNVDGLQVPLSIFGISASFEEYSIDISLPSSLSDDQQCQPCNSSESMCLGDTGIQPPMVDEAVHLLTNNFLKQAFIDASRHLVPESYELHLETISESSHLLLSKYEYMNFIGFGRDLIDEGICGGDVTVMEDELYLAVLMNRPAIFSYNNETIFSYSPKAKSDSFCIVINVGCSNVVGDQHLLMSVPSELSSVLKDYLLNKKFLQEDDVIVPVEIVVQRDGITDSTGAAYGDKVWNGHSMVNLPNQLYDVKQSINSLEKSLRSSDNLLSMDAVLKGDLYHHSNPNHAMTGKFIGSGSISMTFYDNYAINLMLSDETPLYFSLKGYSNTNTLIESGIAFHADHVTDDSTSIQQLFPNTPRIPSCPVDYFIRLDQIFNMQWISFVSSCTSPTIHGLSFEGGVNQFKHLILIRSNETSSQSAVPLIFKSDGAPVQIVSDVPVGGVPLNSFMKVMQPSSGNALTIQIWPGEEHNNIAILPMVEIDLYGTQTVTEVMVDSSGVHFEYNTQLFDGVSARISVKSMSAGYDDWNDMLFNVSISILPDQGFMSDLQPSVMAYVNGKVNLLSNRLSNLLTVRQTLDSLIKEQTLKVNESNSVLNTHKLQYSELMTNISVMKKSHREAQLLYDGTMDTNSAVYNNMRKVCNLAECSTVCHATPTLQSIADFDYIYQWMPDISNTDTVEKVSVLEGMVSEERWMLGEKCRPITIVTGWAQTAVGQDCSYQYHKTDRHPWYRPFTERSMETVQVYGTEQYNRYSYRDDFIYASSDDCGLIVDDTNCLLENLACFTMWESIYNNISDTSLKESMSPLLNLVDNESSIETSKQTLVLLEKQIHLLNEVHVNELRALEALKDLRKSTDGNFAMLQELLKNYTLFKSSDKFTKLNVTILTMEIMHEREQAGTAKMVMEYEMDGATADKIITDIYVDLPLTLNILKDQLIRTLFQKMMALPQTPPSFPVSSQQQYYSLQCSLIDANKMILGKILEVLKSQNTRYASAQITTGGIFNTLADDMQSDINITDSDVISFTEAENLFSTLIHEEMLYKVIDKNNPIHKLKNSLSKLEVFTELYLSSYRPQQYYTLLNTLDSIYTLDKIAYINGEICYGFFDCMKQMDFETSETYKSTPIKSTTYSTYLKAVDMLNSSLLLDDTSTLTGIQDSLMEYWCGDAPTFSSDMSDATIALHIGDAYQLSCSEGLHSNLPITSYTWFKNGYELAVGEELAIDNVSPLDSGWYQCTAGNDISYTSSPIWIIEVIQTPTIITDPVSLYTFEGDDNGAVFKCNVSVQEGSVYSWYYSPNAFDWTLIADSDSNELVVENALKSANEGWYRCRVTSSSLKLVSDKAYLTVLGAGISELSREAVFKAVSKAADVSSIAWNKTDISNQLMFNLQPEYTRIQVDNISIIHNTVAIVELRLSVQPGYDPLKGLPELAMEARKYEQDLLHTIQNLKSKISSSEPLDFVVEDSSFEAQADSLELSELSYVCPPGKGLQLEQFLCVDCLPGEYGSDSRCQSCPIGTYQSNTGKGSCYQCQEGYGTKSVGATQNADCSELCIPGTISVTGFPPCDSCDEGYYQTEYGGKACQRCQPNDHLNISQCPVVNVSDTISPSPSNTANDTLDDPTSSGLLSDVTRMSVIVFGSIGLAAVLVVSIIIILVVYNKRKKKSSGNTDIQDVPLFTSGSDDGDLLKSDDLVKVNPLYNENEDTNTYADLDSAIYEITKEEQC